MKREITKEEIRDFFANGAKQFAEAGFYLHQVKFVDGEVYMNYEEREIQTKRFKKPN